MKNVSYKNYMTNFKTKHIKPGIINLTKHYSLTGKNLSYNYSDSELQLNIESLSNIRKLSNLEKIKRIDEYYSDMFNNLNLSGSLNFRELLGRKKSKEYLDYLRKEIDSTSCLITNYHTEIFKNRIQCYSSLSSVELAGEILQKPVYNHSSITGRTSIIDGFNFLTLKKEKRKNIKPVDKTKCLVEVDFKSCEPFFYLKSNNFIVESDDVYAWLCEKYQIKLDNRDYVKRGILSMIYGANENTISKVMKIPKSKVIKIKEDLGLVQLKKELQKKYDESGFFLNYYGRPITSDNNLVNYYIQSSAVDYCSLAFHQFCKKEKVNASYFIHDSMTFQCEKNRLNEILNIKSITDSFSNISIPVEFNVLYR